MPILARLMLNKGMINRDQLSEGIRNQVVYGGRIGANLVELGHISEHKLAETLGEKHGVPWLDTEESTELPEKPSELLPAKLAARYKVYPLKKSGRTLHLLTIDPDKRVPLFEITSATGLMLRPIVVPQVQMLRLLEKGYQISEAWRFGERVGADVAPEDSKIISNDELLALGMDEAIARMQKSPGRDETIRAFLEFASNFFERAAFFFVRGDNLRGWTGYGDGVDASLLRSTVMPLSKDSVFRTVFESQSHYIGPVDLNNKVNKQFLKLLGKKVPHNVFLYPIFLRGRLVNIFYGDRGHGKRVTENVSDLLIAGGHIPQAYERIIMERLQASEA